MKKKFKLHPKRSGECLLLPVEAIPKGKTTKHTSLVIAHSESGHHHVLEAKNPFEMTETETGQLYIKIFGDAAIVHKKTTDKHNDLKVDETIYKRFHDTEYDPFEKVIRDSKD